MKELSLIILLMICWICCYIGFVKYIDQQQCTEQCRVKELQLQKEIQELKWRYELINDIKR